LSFWAVAPLLLAAFAFLACAASFGLWLSVRAPTVQRATGVWLLIVGLWVGGTFLAAEVAYEVDNSLQRYSMPSSGERPAPLVWDRALNPALAWSELSFRVRDDEAPSRWQLPDGQVDSPADVWPSVFGVCLYAALAWALFKTAARRFEREGRV